MNLLSIFIIPISLLFLLIVPTTVHASEADPVAVQTFPGAITPTLYCLGSCPTAPSVPNQISTSTSPAPSTTSPSTSPSGLPGSAPSVDPTQPCESETVSVQHKGKKKHAKKKKGAIGNGMEQFIRFLIELINLILRLIGGGTMPLPTPTPTDPCDPNVPQPSTEPEPTTGTEPTTTVSQTPGAPSTPVSPSTGVSAAPSPSGTATQPTPPVTGNWKLVFNDDFNGTSIDKTKWNTGWFGEGITKGVNGNEENCYDSNQLTVADGSAVITLIQKATTCGGKTQPYTTGMANTMNKYTFVHGYAESRMWMPGGATISNWPGFWINGVSHEQGGEIDVMEGLSGKACYHYHHDGSTGGCANGTWTNGWHTFGSLWEAGKVTFYYDGKLVGTSTNGVASQPMYILLQNATGKWGGPRVAPAVVKFDYVKVWQKQ